ncbi:hypothetical protein ACM7Q1_10050 [Paenibacillus illinoisensis]
MRTFHHESGGTTAIEQAFLPLTPEILQVNCCHQIDSEDVV